MKVKKITLTLVVILLGLVLTSCQNSAPPTPVIPIYTVNGLWTMTTVVTHSDIYSYDVGDTDVGITLVETNGNTITFRNPNGTSNGFSGTKTKNHVEISQVDKSLNIVINGDFLSEKAFTGKMFISSRTTKQKVVFSVSMAKR